MRSTAAAARKMTTTSMSTRRRRLFCRWCCRNACLALASASGDGPSNSTDSFQTERRRSRKSSSSLGDRSGKLPPHTANSRSSLPYNGIAIVSKTCFNRMSACEIRSAPICCPKCGVFKTFTSRRSSDSGKSRSAIFKSSDRATAIRS